MTYTIYKDGVKCNTIVADEEFCKEYYSTNGYSYEKYIPPISVIEIPTEEKSTKTQTT